MEEGAYEQHYRQEDQHWWFRGRRDVIWSLLRHAGLPDNPRLLDAGCGTGRNLVEFGGLGPALGIDPSTQAVDFCRRRGLDNVTEARIEELPFPDDSFDLILACDVIEHVPDDAAALTELRRVSASGGLLLLTVPAYGWMWSPHDVFMHHYRRYTLRGLRKRVRAAGWEPVVDSYFMTAILPVAAAARLAWRATRRRPASDIDRTPPWLNRAVLAPVRAEAAAIGRGVRLPAGVSVGMVCR
jgi:SAM-dependent methyltransferase